MCTETVLYSFSSADRTSGSINSFTVPVQFYNQVVGIELVSFTTPTLSYNVPPNNSFTLVDTNGTFVITVPSALYTGNALASELTTLFNAVSAGYTVTFGSPNVFTFTNAGFDFTLTFTRQSLVQSVLGFGIGTYSSTAHALISPFEAILSVYPQLFIRLVQAAPNRTSGGTQWSFFVNNTSSTWVPENTNSNESFLTYTSHEVVPTQQKITFGAISLNALTVLVTDSYGNLIYLPADWNMVLKFFYNNSSTYFRPTDGL